MQAWVPSSSAGERSCGQRRPWLGFVLALLSLLMSRNASADDIRVLLEGANTEKLPFLKTYVTLVDGEGRNAEITPNPTPITVVSTSDNVMMTMVFLTALEMS